MHRTYHLSNIESVAHSVTLFLWPILDALKTQQPIALGNGSPNTHATLDGLIRGVVLLWTLTSGLPPRATNADCSAVNPCLNSDSIDNGSTWDQSRSRSILLPIDPKRRFILNPKPRQSILNPDRCRAFFNACFGTILIPVLCSRH